MLQRINSHLLYRIIPSAACYRTDGSIDSVIRCPECALSEGKGRSGSLFSSLHFLRHFLPLALYHLHLLLLLTILLIITDLLWAHYQPTNPCSLEASKLDYKRSSIFALPLFSLFPLPPIRPSSLYFTSRLNHPPPFPTSFLFLLFQHENASHHPILHPRHVPHIHLYFHFVFAL